MIGVAIGAWLAIAAAPWRQARTDHRMVAQVIASAHDSPAQAWFDPAAAIDARVRAPQTTTAELRAAAELLDRRGRWTWSHRDPESVHRWLIAVARATDPPDERERRRVLTRLADMPTNTSDEQARARPTINAWFAPAVPDHDMAARVRAVLFDRLSDGGGLDLADPRFSPRDSRGARLRHLALEGRTGALDAELERAAAPAPPVAAAMLVRLASVDAARLLRADDPAVTRLIAAANADDAVDAALAVAGDVATELRPRILERLRARAAGGSVHAARLLLARPWSPTVAPVPEPESLLAAADPEAPLRAAIAAWRGEAPLDPATAERLMDAAIVPPALTALIVERRLDPVARDAICGAWITSFDDRRKEAGAILVALRGPGGPHVDRLIAAAAREDRGNVRLVQRVALAAVDRTPAGGPAIALLPAVIAADRRPVVALLRGLAGDGRGLAGLTRLPAGADASVIALLDAGLGRLVPAWTDEIGRPVGGGDAAIRLHLDRLEARRLIAGSRLEFDATNRRFTPRTSLGLPATSGATMIAP